MWSPHTPHCPTAGLPISHPARASLLPSRAASWHSFPRVIPPSWPKAAEIPLIPALSKALPPLQSLPGGTTGQVPALTGNQIKAFLVICVGLHLAGQQIQLGWWAAELQTERGGIRGLWSSSNEHCLALEADLPCARHFVFGSALRINTRNSNMDLFFPNSHPMVGARFPGSCPSMHTGTRGPPVFVFSGVAGI